MSVRMRVAHHIGWHRWTTSVLCGITSLRSDESALMIGPVEMWRWRRLTHIVVVRRTLYTMERKPINNNGNNNDNKIMMTQCLFTTINRPDHVNS